MEFLRGLSLAQYFLIFACFIWGRFLESMVWGSTSMLMILRSLSDCQQEIKLWLYHKFVK